MGIMARLIITMLIIFIGGFCIGMLWGIFIGGRKNEE